MCHDRQAAHMAHKLVCGTHKLVCATHKLVCGTHKLVCGTHKFVCGTHKLVCGTHKLVCQISQKSLHIWKDIQKIRTRCKFIACLML